MNNISKSLWLQIVPGYIVGVVTILLLVFGIISPYYLIFTFFMWVLVCGLGIAAGYHRVFSHKTHTLPLWKENIILFFAAFAGQGSSIFWAALHRGYHHPYADTDRDIHSPIILGKFHAFLGWHSKITGSNNSISMKYAIDLLRKPNHIWFHKHNLRILWGIPLIISLIDWKFALTAFCLVTFIGVLQDNIVNVVGHSYIPSNYRNFETNDNSHNNALLAYITWGQAWHNNHHYCPGSFDFGKSISGKYWEIDMCNLFIIFLGKSNAKK